MEAVQLVSMICELYRDLGDYSSVVPIATGVSCLFLKKAGPLGRAKLRCKHMPRLG